MTQVTPLFGNELQQSDKQAMLDYVAQRFDAMASSGDTPVCILFGLVSEKGAASASYMTSSSITDHNVLYLSRAMMALNVDYHVWDNAVT